MAYGRILKENSSLIETKQPIRSGYHIRFCHTRRQTLKNDACTQLVNGVRATSEFRRKYF